MKLSRSSTLVAATLTVLGYASAGSAQQLPGEQIYRQRCQACHTLASTGAPGPIAPNLRGVFGRKAATTSFATYSAALKASKIVWSRDALDKFLSAPAKMVPGTRMVISVAAASLKEELIAFLSAQH